jgi:TonB family protein
MFWIALLAVAQLSAPPAKNLVGLFASDDVPLQMLGDEADRTVGIRLTVRPEGQVQSCEVEYSSGIAELDLYTCKLAAKRSKFAPASRNGTPAYAVYRLPVRYLVTSGRRSPVPPRADFTIRINELPRDVRSPAAIHLVFEVDERGHPSACKAEDIQGKFHADAQLVGRACDQLLKDYTAIPARDEGGKVVPSVQDAIVQFRTQ